MFSSRRSIACEPNAVARFLIGDVHPCVLSKVETLFGRPVQTYARAEDGRPIPAGSSGLRTAL